MTKKIPTAAEVRKYENIRRNTSESYTNERKIDAGMSLLVALIR